MRRIMLVALTMAACVVTVSGVGGLAAPAAHADVDDFAIESFDATYTLGRDDDGRSILTTVEHIVAVFPDFDQNRGLIRDLTRVYDGHDTGVTVVSVTDGQGDPRDFVTEPYGDFLAVTMAVPEGQFVHGEQHYVIEYTQHDVTRLYEDTGVDEFYWDINGTGWTQPFGRVSARVVLDPSLEFALTGEVACYRGSFGATEQCEVQQTHEHLSVEEETLAPGENVTLAIAFTPGTFASAPTPAVPFFERVPVLLWAGIGSLLAAIATWVTALVRGRGAQTGRAIIAQYEPPEGMSVALAATLLKQRRKTMTATLLDFAVRRKIRLLHHAETHQYGIQSLDGSGLLPLESRLYTRIFSAKVGPSATQGDLPTADTAPGTTYWFDRKSTRLGDAAADLTRRAATEANAQGLTKRADGKTIAWVAGLLVAALAFPVLHAVLLENFLLMTVLLAVGINALVWLLIGSIATLAMRRRPTHKGALLLDHLHGLREYIRLAEADRIRMLQSVTGAEVNEQFIVQVYERLLPYAVLFGFEKEWQDELARYYRESTPDWVHDSTGQSFTSALPIAAFAHSVTSAPVTRSSSSGGRSGSSFSSSRGGSSGGGFSGGGGGGGGGRGI